MKPVLLVALSLCFAGVALAATPAASACTPPNCPGWGGCHVTWEEVYFDPDLGLPPQKAPSGIECYY